MDITKKLKALSHETRLEIVRMLLQRSMCVRALARHFSVTEPTISVHLRVLREAGLLRAGETLYGAAAAPADGKADLEATSLMFLLHSC